MGCLGHPRDGPHPDRLIVALRQIGYSLEQALSDLIDNALSAGAIHI